MKWLKNNSLSITFFILFIISMVGQAITGLKDRNHETIEDGGQPIRMSEYLMSGHFFQATFENWESEFLQMALFLVFTVFLYQKGSSESKDPDKKEEVDREPDPNREGAPWPVKEGGLIGKLYQHSFFIAFTVLFIASFLLHWYGSVRDYNDKQKLKGLPTETALQYLSNERLWFESFQNWQSEFLSIFAIVILSIFLREKGSPQSKPVDAPDSETEK